MALIVCHGPNIDFSGIFAAVNPAWLPDLQPLNNFLSVIRYKYRDSKLQQPINYAPLAYSLNALNTRADILTSLSGNPKLHFPYPTIADPTASQYKEFMSFFERRSGIKYAQLQGLFQTTPISGLPKRALVENMYTSRDTQSIMHWTKTLFKDTGQLDFVLRLYSLSPAFADLLFPFANEHLGGAERLYIPRMRGFVDYGLPSDAHFLKNVQDNHFPLIAVTYSESILQWYLTDPRIQGIGKVAPAVSEDQWLKLVEAMAYIAHPAVRAELEKAIGAGYNPYNDYTVRGDPLKLALYFLKSGVQVPVIDWAHPDRPTGITLPFYEACGFESVPEAELVQTYFGLQVDSAYHAHINKFATWWADRDTLIQNLFTYYSAPPSHRPSLVWPLYWDAVMEVFTT